MRNIYFAILLLCIVSSVRSQEVFERIVTDFQLSVNPKDAEDRFIKDSLGNFYGLVPSTVKYNFTQKSSGALKSTSVDVLPASYDLRIIDDGAYVSSVKSQGESGCCWSFAAMGSVESYHLKKGMGNFDFSEQNLATCNGLGLDPNGGGNTELVLPYFLNLKGPVDESVAPYALPDDVMCMAETTPSTFVQQARFLPGCDDIGFDSENVKKALMEFGGLYVNLFMDVSYYNELDYTYYYGAVHSTSHAVVLVGWDDDKVVTGGSYGAPQNTGAWILKNSWGEDWGEDGFFYVSYDDATVLTKIACFPSAVEYNKSAKAYYYDEKGVTSSIGLGLEYAYGLIKFTTTGNDKVEKLGVSIPSDNAKVECVIYEDFSNGLLSGKLGELSEGLCDYPGFYTFDLDLPFDVEKGKDLYVSYRVETPLFIHPLTTEKDKPNQNGGALIESDKCWVSSNGVNWMAIGNSVSVKSDLCAKLYVTESDNSSSVTGEMLELGFKVFPNPSNGVVNIHFYGNHSEIINVNIIDVLGNILHTNSIDLNNKLCINNLAAGTYFVQVNYLDETIVEKLFVE